MERDLKKIVSEMTLEEKAGMCSGLDFWHLKEVEHLGIPKHTSYARERMQYDAIRSGQVEQILSLLQQKPDGTEGILSKDQLRNSKNMFIAGITLFTRAAIDGGVPEETAYSLSDGYIQTVEECTNSVSIEKLSQRAAARFAQEVYDPRKRMEMIPYLVTSRNIC